MSIAPIAQRTICPTHFQRVLSDCLTRIKTNVANFIESYWRQIAAVCLVVAIAMGSTLGVLGTAIGALCAWHFVRIRNPVGIVYGITNQYGVTSLLIGTCHYVDEDSFYHPSIEPMIRNCAKL